ncbi:MAG: CoB--CoM heterodisulfide reductase iron-sulfur subunit A family protein [Bacteroidales bacterium]|nr:CoB--CoM heterodisulfide reductase iron-sulfur subunit A family protein [Bacteroidales bacterium]
MMKKIGVYICQCGSNISDVVDVDKVEAAISDIEGVQILKTTMFACADSAQKEMVDDITTNQLEGLVVASCSPKLHVPTFRNVAKRAGLNPYQYVHVNIREQGSWAHSDHPAEATEKAIQLVMAGITRVQFARALDPIWINAENSVAVIGAGVTGIRAAIGLAALGTKVFLLERNDVVGGKIMRWGKLTGSERTGVDLVEQLKNDLVQNKDIQLFTGIEIKSVSGSVGDFTLNFVEAGQNGKPQQIRVGAVILSTGFDPYNPGEGEFGYGSHPAVITLPELKEAIRADGGISSWNGRKVGQIAFIYCVGSCQTEGESKYCSRICCTTTLDTAIQIKQLNPGIDCIHLYRQMRTYGKQELFYEEAGRNGDLFMKFEDNDPPDVDIENGQISVKVRDQLTMGEEIEMHPDLLVLVTGMVPSQGYLKAAELFKAPVGRDKFFNEVHPKLRPVETVIDGIFIAGACQGPKNIPESIKSGLSAVAKTHALLHEEKIELEPSIAYVDPARCTWCDLCSAVCPFDAIKMEEHKGKQVATVISSSCKGCGMCTPVCPADAIDLIGYTNDEIEGMIDSLIATV